MRTKTLRTWIVNVILITAALCFMYGMYTLARWANYEFQYRDYVMETLCKSIKSEALNDEVLKMCKELSDES